MCRMSKFISVALLVTLAGCQQTAPVREPERVVSAVGGPERVFTRPVAEIVPQLQNARATGPNGRVGDELVFWGYEIAAERPAFLTACAVLADVDCAARLDKVCPSGRAQTLASHEEPGEVRHLNCRLVGLAAPGDLTPNCSDIEKTQAIAVTLLSCQ